MTGFVKNMKLKDEVSKFEAVARKTKTDKINYQKEKK